MKRRRKSKKWIGKYFKLSTLTAQKLSLLSEYLSRSETEIVEELINGYYKLKFGDVDPKIALQLIKK